MTRPNTLPPTGRTTISVDWSAELNNYPRCGATLVSAAWTLPQGVALVAQTIEGNRALVTVSTTNLAVGSTVTIVCTATFSNGDILPAATDHPIAFWRTKPAKESCPV
jgi:hypothetical protein